MYSIPLRSVLFFLLATALFLFSATAVFAQNAGVRISPALIEETIDPGIVKEYEFEVQNLNAYEQTFFLFTRNIRDVGVGGAPIFAEDNERTGYELADWVAIGVTEITIAPDAKATVPFIMTVPEDASPGSHFGGVFVSVDPPDIENSGAAVGYQVANILSIRVSGDAVESANIRQFSTTKFLYGAQDVDFNVRLENSGNVLVRPTGPIEINNSLGRTVGTITFNESEAGVFPGNIREFSNINWVGDSAGFGRYEAVLSAVYGANGARKTISSTVTFWVLPFNIIGPALGVLAVLLLVTIVGVKMYIRRTLAQMNVGRRLVTKRNQPQSSMNLLLVVAMLVVLALFLLIMLILFA